MFEKNRLSQSYRYYFLMNKKKYYFCIDRSGLLIFYKYFKIKKNSEIQLKLEKPFLSTT